MARVWNLLVALLLLGQTTGNAKPPAAAPVEDRTRVFIITMGPGSDPWEKFGHNMLWMNTPAGEFTYNWGVFEFDNQFIPHFLQGKLWYWMQEDHDPDAVVTYYIKNLDRTVWVQELNFTPAQKQALLAACQTNALEENKHYKYDYFTDNCSTRVRDAIDRALDGQIKRQATATPSDVTYRSETQRLTAGVVWLYVA